MGEIVRLQKYIAMCGTASRRAAEKLIEDGKVKVNGQKITELGTKVEIGADLVTVNGKVQKFEQKKYYIALNKPKGYVTTASDEKGRAVVTELVADIPARLFPVGRLDINTDGLLIMTNDGDFAQLIAHPSKEIKKVYLVTAVGILTEKDKLILENGVVIDGEKTAPAKLSLVDQKQTLFQARITIHQGRNRQVRKMFAAVGNKVQELERIALGELRLGRLMEGHYRKLKREEIEYLKSL
jgi:23S rRNA pseudouridine2605 synthase